MRILAVIAASLTFAAPAAAQPRQTPPWYKERPLCGGRWGGSPGLVCRFVMERLVIVKGI